MNYSIRKERISRSSLVKIVVTQRDGSVLLLVALALTVILALAGLAMDIGQIYLNRIRAQAAADAAAQAGILDMFNGTNTGSNAFGTASMTCPTTGGVAPCKYAGLNGFGGTASDSVTLDFFPQTPSVASCTAPGVTLSEDDPVQLICVTVTRTVETSFLKLMGETATTVKARAIAAIVIGGSSAPIIILHPTLSGAFSTNGSNTIEVCSGPARSIQVNSTSATSISISGGGTVDLSHAGPLDTGNCSTGTGGNFANVGAQSPYPGTLLLGTKPGLYIEPASIVRDPLLRITPPVQPATIGSSVTYSTTDLENAHNCPMTCTVYSPGYYANGIAASGFCVFRPGIYWINHGGFSTGSNTIVRMAQAAVDQTDPTGTTSWTSGMLIYNSPSTPVSTKNDIISVGANSGKINNNTYPTVDCPNGGSCLLGSPGSSAYEDILFFQNRATAANLVHSFGGGGSLSVTGTLYATHTASSIASDSHYEALGLQGSSGSTTVFQGGIITDTISVGGNSTITMILSPVSHMFRAVALVQ